MYKCKEPPLEGVIYLRIIKPLKNVFGSLYSKPGVGDVTWVKEVKGTTGIKGAYYEVVGETIRRAETNYKDLGIHIEQNRYSTNFTWDCFEVLSKDKFDLLTAVCPKRGTKAGDILVRTADIGSNYLYREGDIFKCTHMFRESNGNYRAGFQLGSSTTHYRFANDAEIAFFNKGGRTIKDMPKTPTVPKTVERRLKVGDKVKLKSDLSHTDAQWRETFAHKFKPQTSGTVSSVSTYAYSKGCPISAVSFEDDYGRRCFHDASAFELVTEEVKPEAKESVICSANEKIGGGIITGKYYTIVSEENKDEPIKTSKECYEKPLDPKDCFKSDVKLITKSKKRKLLKISIAKV